MIKVVLKEDNVKISEDEYLLSSLVRACKLKNDQIQTRLPIQKGLLGLLIKEVDKHFMKLNQPFLNILYKTLLLTTYFGLLQISEVTDGGHVVLAKDVHIGDNKNNSY